MMSDHRAREIAAATSEYAWKAIKEAAARLDRRLDFPAMNCCGQIGVFGISPLDAGMQADGSYDGTAVFRPRGGADMSVVAAYVAATAGARRFAIRFNFNSYDFLIIPGAFYYDILKTYYESPEGAYTIKPRVIHKETTYKRERSIMLN